MIDTDGIDRDELIRNLTEALEITTGYYATESDRAKNAEKAVELMAQHTFILMEQLVGSDDYEYWDICKHVGEYRMPDKDSIIEYFMQKAREAE